EIDAAQARVPLDEEGIPTYLVHASEFGLEAAQAQEEIDAVIADVGSLGGDGGVIVVTREGHPLFSMNTSG
ncbi:MAG TPA: isoaspartyl peptidase/L-asparaginase, partial [Erythrobacter sp.]|nr:isoaspartyl peptidase/L-asparaginase [Erythrobacter sp.]